MRWASVTPSCQACGFFPILLLRMRPQNTHASLTHLWLLPWDKCLEVGWWFISSQSYLKILPFPVIWLCFCYHIFKCFCATEHSFVLGSVSVSIWIRLVLSLHIGVWPSCWAQGRALGSISLKKFFSLASSFLKLSLTFCPFSFPDEFWDSFVVVQRIPFGILFQLLRISTLIFGDHILKFYRYKPVHPGVQCILAFIQCCPLFVNKMLWFSLGRSLVLLKLFLSGLYLLMPAWLRCSVSLYLQAVMSGIP